MARTIYVNCSFCTGLMEVDAESGEVVKKWSPKDRAAGGNTMEDALKKLSDDQRRRATLFDDTKGQIDSQKKKVEDVFRKEVDRIKREGIKDPPPNPFDRD